MNKQLILNAQEILRENDRGKYTVPTKGLYPFQWNWDSCLSALGFAYFDEARAWQEIETLFEHQWEDGMVPHIVFHEIDDGYFPGPDVWGTEQKTGEVLTSGITQPAVAGMVVRKLYERAQDRDLARAKVELLLPKIAKWHDWFFDNRDPQGTGLVAVLHPWETGRDNSVDWDLAFTRVPTDNVKDFVRRDTQHANPAHRPTQAQYLRYIWLVQHFRSLAWDNSKLHEASPFKVVDPGFNAILLKSCADVAMLGEEISREDIVQRASAQHALGVKALDSLWSEKWQQYLCYDRVSETLIDSPSIGGLLGVLASADHAAEITQRLYAIKSKCQYLVPSHDPEAEEFEGLRYWRGPVWLVVNFLIYEGLNAAGETAICEQIKQDSIELIKQSGFAEYYEPNSGEPCGGTTFTWTAAMVIEFLQRQ